MLTRNADLFFKVRQLIIASKSLNPSITPQQIKISKTLLECEIKSPQKNKKRLIQYVSRTLKRGSAHYQEHNRKKISRTTKAIIKINKKVLEKKINQ